MSDIIFALASAKGRAGVSIIRISGANSICSLEKLVKKKLPVDGRCLRKIYDLENNIIDETLILTFKEKASFTGDEVVEIHCHGSTAVVSYILRTLSDLRGLRIAEPGEFTRRALENGKLDLTQVEGLADLIESETEAQRRLAMRSMGGALSKKVQRWRIDLIRAVSLIEATIDFADEDIPVDVTPEVLELINRTQTDLKTEIQGSFAAERIREGFEVAIVGAPNIGKSTLLNILGMLDVAEEGDYILDNVPIKNLNETKAAKYRNKFLGFVFQSFNLINYKTALENVSLPLYYQGIPRKERQQSALNYLEKVGLKDWATHLPSELSGGQKQRVAIARALASKPKVLLADEPTGALDSTTSHEVMDLIQKINQEGKTILVVTHELDIAQMCKRIVKLKDGVIVEDKKVKQVLASSYV